MPLPESIEFKMPAWLLFYPCAFLWLPPVFLLAVVIGLGDWFVIIMAYDAGQTIVQLSKLAAPSAPFGLPLALACRWIWRKGYRRSAWATFALLVLPSACTAQEIPVTWLEPFFSAAGASLLAVPVLVAAALLKRKAQEPEPPDGTDLGLKAE